MPWLALSLLVLGALAGFTTLESRRLETRFPPVGTFAEVNGVRLHYRVAGRENHNNRPIVLLHGASTSLLDFHASLLPPLAEHYRQTARVRADTTDSFFKTPSTRQ